MADIKWIKITTDIFDDEKIKIIDTMPARDEILVIWFKLLSLAGKVNENGLLFMNHNLAYTPEMLAAIFNREILTVKLSLNTFQQFGMIEISEHEIISISNWEKHQNIDGMEKIRIQNNTRQQKHRDKQKQLLLNDNSNVTHNVTVTDSHATDKDKIRLDKSSINKDIVDVDIEVTIPTFDYKSVYDYYLTLDLIKHTKYTKEMTKSIKHAKDNLSIDEKEMERMLKRHEEKVIATKSKGQYKTKKRPLQEFFGQKKSGSTCLICSDYLDENLEEEMKKTTEPKFTAPWYEEGKDGQSN